MEDRIIFGHDLKQRHPKTELQDRMQENEFYLGYSKVMNRLMVVRPNSIVMVDNYPQQFYEEAIQEHPVKRTII
jgi:hypothetical protein